MNSAETEQLRVCLLQALRQVAGTELPLATLLLGARLAGFRASDERAVAAELSYLEDKRLVVQAGKAVSPENREWRITAEGRDYLATRGF
ncbi:MAG: hypothetical protein HZC55_04140 [Verrucomicrobia bacterium]|nr:hypothetical protein [Verrucomicrobiota bacterium]